MSVNKVELENNIRECCELLPKPEPNSLYARMGVLVAREVGLNMIRAHTGRFYNNALCFLQKDGFKNKQVPAVGLVRDLARLAVSHLIADFCNWSVVTSAHVGLQKSLEIVENPADVAPLSLEKGLGKLWDSSSGKERTEVTIGNIFGIAVEMGLAGELQEAIVSESERRLSRLQKESNIKDGILFEIHHSVGGELGAFESFCKEAKIKSVSNSTSHGLTQCAHRGNNTSAEAYAKGLASEMTQRGLNVFRLRIETSLANPVVPWGKESPRRKDQYFEGHVNVVCPDGKHGQLEEIVRQHPEWHLCAVIPNGNRHVRIVTIRGYDNAESFLKQIDETEKALLEAGFPRVAKTNPEYVVFDEKYYSR